MSLNGLPIAASSNGYSKDFDQFTPEEIMELNDSDLRKLTSPYSLDALCEAINNYGFEFKLSKKQQTILHEFYKHRENSSVELSREDFNKIEELISQCKAVRGPDMRQGQPEKNFAELHGLEMGPQDYLAIVKKLTFDDYVGTIKSSEKDRLGILLYEFICNPGGYKLRFDGTVLSDDIKIYIKIVSQYVSKYTIAIISFHDPDAETLADLDHNS